MDFARVVPDTLLPRKKCHVSVKRNSPPGIFPDGELNCVALTYRVLP